MMTQSEHDSLMRLHQSVGRIEGKVDGILEEQKQLNTYIQATSTRVGVLEQLRSGMKGWVAGASMVAGIIGALVAILIRTLT